MSAENPTKHELEKLTKAAKELARLKKVIAPFIKEKKPIEVATRGKWRDGSIAVFSCNSAKSSRAGEEFRRTKGGNDSNV